MNKLQPVSTKLHYKHIIEAVDKHQYSYRRSIDNKYWLPVGRSPLAVSGDRMAAWKLWQDSGMSLPKRFI